MGLIVGVLAGLIGVGAAVFAVIYALGIVEYLGGKKKSTDCRTRKRRGIEKAPHQYELS